MKHQILVEHTGRIISNIKLWNSKPKKRNRKLAFLILNDLLLFQLMIGVKLFRELDFLNDAMDDVCMFINRSKE